MEIGVPVAVNNITNFVKEDHHDHDPDHNDQYYHDLVNLPPGFRFHPTDEEIITHYLTQKVIKPSFTASAIGHVDLNKCEPWDLPQKAKMGEKEWFFFCQRDRKYPTGMRTNRATDSGYWKATGKDREIYKHGRLGCLVGMKKTLVFYKGRAPKGEKTNWVMHEFRLHGKFSYYNFPNPSKDEWVVCKVFHKNTSTAGIKRSISTDDQHLQVMTTFVDGFLDSPCPSSSLPPLVDAHAPQPQLQLQPAGYYKIPSSCFTNYKDNDISGGDDQKSKIKGSAVTSDDAENSYLSYMSYNLYVDKHYTVPYSPQLTLPNHHDQAEGANMCSDRNRIQPQQGIIGRGFKGEYSTSCGMISHSQDTGLSTAHDMNTEISSSVGAATSGISSSNKSNSDDPDADHDHHVPGGLVGAPSLSYLDSFWEY